MIQLQATVKNKRIKSTNIGKHSDTKSFKFNQSVQEQIIKFMTIGLYIFIGMICFVVALTIGGLVYMCKTNCPYRFPRVFGDEFGDEFGDSLNFVSKLVTHLVIISVNHRIW